MDMCCQHKHQVQAVTADAVLAVGMGTCMCSVRWLPRQQPAVLHIKQMVDEATQKCV